MKPIRPVPTRARLAAAVGGVALTLVGCGTGSPGVAATVGEETITVAEVDRTAESLCAAYESDLLGQQGGPVPLSDIRFGALQLLTAGAQARQVAADYDIEAGGEDYTRELTDLERSGRAAGLDDQQVEDYATTLGVNALALSVIDRIGRIELSGQGQDDPTVEEATQVGQEAFNGWLSDNEVEFNPRYGLSAEGGSLTVADSALSVAVSDLATQGSAEQADPAYAESLPDSQRCG